MASVAQITTSSIALRPLHHAADQAAPRAATAKPGSVAALPTSAVQLSERGKALVEKAKADLAAADHLDDSFDEMVSKRTDALATRLATAFGKLNIPPEYATHMKVDKFGNVSAEGPWKAKIEKMFSDDPALAKEMKEVSGLNNLKAAQASLDLYHAQQKSANTDAKRAELRKNYDIRALNIQTLSGVMNMKDGKLRSAAVDYVDMLTNPVAAGSPDKIKNAIDRLA